MSANPFVAIQIGPNSFLEEGTDNALDILQERGAVNALLLASHSFCYGTAGRAQYRFPDHGAQEPDHMQGGSFIHNRPQYYAKTSIRDFRAPDRDSGGIDIMDEVVPKATSRGMKVYAWINESPFDLVSKHVPGYIHCLEEDMWGRKAWPGCFNNPDFKGLHLGVVEEHVKHYDLAGVALISERRGPLGNVLNLAHNSRNGMHPTCFCQYCRAIARERGINVDRAKAGYVALSEFIAKAAKKERPVDGYFVEFWRILLNYPEILSWEKLWTDGQLQLYKDIYGTVKAIDPKKEAGFHIVHVHSFSPLYRAIIDFSELKRYADWLKPVLYHNCAGVRFQNYVRDLCGGVFGDSTPDKVYRMYYDFLGYEEAPLEELHKTGFSADYVYRETKRSVAAVNDEIPIYPGIDVDIPPGRPPAPENKRSTPDDVGDAVKAAFRGGARGVVISRKYSEMFLDNLSACGDAVRSLR